MREAFLTALLAIISTSAAAEWVEMKNFKRYTLYAEPASIRKTGNIVNMSHLYDLHMIDEVAGKQFRSVVSKASYSCKSAKSRMLSASAYRGNMAKSVEKIVAGKITTNRGRRSISHISEPGKWKPIMSGSAEELLWKFVCEQRRN